MIRFIAICLPALVWATLTSPHASAETIKLTLHPVKPSAAALRYRLLPELRDQKPGNAAELYKRAIAILMSTPVDTAGKQERDQLLDKWAKLPLKELPRAEVRRFLATYKEMLRLVDQAAYRERCDWGLAERLREKGVGALLSEVQPLREIARFLVLRARVEMAEGKLGDALHTLQTGFAVSRHIGDEPTLINALVGIAIASLMAGQLDELIQQPGEPNLYWPLTDLPRPLLDLRRSLQGERIMAYGTFPGFYEAVTDLRAGPVPPEKARPLVKYLAGILAGEPGDVPRLVSYPVLIGRVIDKHEQAKRVLIELGRPPELVESMPHIQVALLHSFAEYDSKLDEIVKWQTRPYWESRLHLAELMKREKAESLNAKDAPAVPLARFFLPAVGKVFLARSRIDRKIAALRCVEAIRLHAARTGALPAKLADIKDVPLPLDPFNGAKFQYKLDGGRAVLFSPPPVGEGPAQWKNALSYEIMLKR